MAAYEIPGFSITLVSDDDFSASQFRFVTVKATTGAADAPAARGFVAGVRQNKPEAGQACTVMVTGVSIVEAGETIAAGEFVTTGTDGRALDADTAADYIAGIALTGGDAGDFISVLLLNGLAQVPA